MSESSNIEIISYNDYIRKVNKTNYSKLDRKMGYLGTVDETKNALETLFNKARSSSQTGQT